MSYSTSATTKGGREGRARLDDGGLALAMGSPKEIGGAGDGHNPEQLFALGYSACFAGALGLVASQRKADVSNAKITCRATIGKEDGGFGLAFEIDVVIPGMAQDQAQELVDAAHGVCPYSKAFKNGAPSIAKAQAD